MTTTPRARAIFGREPSAWVGLIEALIALLIMFPAINELGLTQEWATIVLAVVSAAAGIYTAWATRDTMLGAILGFVKAVIVLFAFYGLEATTDQQGAIVAATAVLVGFFQRTQTTPVDRPLDPSPTQTVATQAVPGALPEEGEARQVTEHGERAAITPAFPTAPVSENPSPAALVGEGWTGREEVLTGDREVVPVDEEPDKRRPIV